jgi:hypothetical protein
MTSRFDTDAWIETVAPAMGLTIAPAWRAGVKANLEATVRAAELVLTAPLDDAEDEPAPVFKAG